MTTEEKTTAEAGEQNEKDFAAEAGEQANGETRETPYEQARKAVLSLEDWDDIADVELLRSLLKEQRLEKEFIISILAEKSKRLKMSTEFKKILSAVKKEVAKDRDYMRSTYNFISFTDAPLALASRNFSCDDSSIYHMNNITFPCRVMGYQQFM